MILTAVPDILMSYKPDEAESTGAVQKLECFGFVYEHTTVEPDGVTARIWTLNPKIVSHSTCAIISGL